MNLTQIETLVNPLQTIASLIVIVGMEHERVDLIYIYMCHREFTEEILWGMEDVQG